MSGRGQDAPHQGATALGRGVFLIVVAVVIGVVTLHSIGKTTPAASTSPTAPPTTATTPPTTAAAAPAHSGTTAGSAARPPGQVLTLVANGTRTSGVAGRISDSLQRDGYNILSPTDTSGTANSSGVYYTSGYNREATAVGSFLGLPASAVQPMSSGPSVIGGTKGAAVIVVIGPDLASQTSGPASGPSSSSNTTTTSRTH